MAKGEKKSRTRVKCVSCRWVGQRMPKDCDCDFELHPNCGCTWGRCPKCGHKVETAEWLRLIKVQQKQTDEFWKTHQWVDGKGLITLSKEIEK